MFKDVKIIQCQRLAPKDGKVHLKFLRDIVIDGDKEYKQNEVTKVDVNAPFKAKIDIVNKTKGTTSHIEYEFIVLTD